MKSKGVTKRRNLSVSSDTSSLVLESDIERSFARRCIFPCLKFHGLGDRGKADRIVFVVGGKPWLLEFKKPGEVPTAIQAHWASRMRKLGYRVTTIDSKELAEEYLQLFKYYAKHRDLCFSLGTNLNPDVILPPQPKPKKPKPLKMKFTGRGKKASWKACA